MRTTPLYHDHAHTIGSRRRTNGSRRARALYAIAENGSEAFIMLIGAGAMATAGVASLLDPEVFIHVTWLDGNVTRSASVRTGFFTPFVERRLRDAGLR